MIEVLIYVLISFGFLCFLRVIYGPTMADRMVAIDIFGIVVVGICALLVIKTGRLFLIDVAIAWIVLGFIATITLAKYLTRRKLDE